MPLAVVSTNLPKENIPHDFMVKLSNVLQTAFECNQNLCMVDLRPDSLMMRAGTTEPTVNVELHHSYDKVTDDTKKEFGKTLADFFMEQLNIGLDRILVLFFDTRCTTKPKTTTEITDERMTTSL